MSKFEKKLTQTLVLTLDQHNSLTIEVGETEVSISVRGGGTPASIKVSRAEFAKVGQALGNIFPQPSPGGYYDR